MNTKEIATEYRMVQWSGLLKERRESGESIKEFCQNKGVSENTYFYWQRKLREAAVKQILPEAAEKSSPMAVPSGWARLAEKEPVKTDGNVLTVEVSGCRIEVNAGTDLELLAKVCRALNAV